MKYFSKGFWKVIGIGLAIIVILAIMLCIVQAIRMAGSDGMSYADMWHDWTPFFQKKPVSDKVVATMLRI